NDSLFGVFISIFVLLITTPFWRYFIKHRQRIFNPPHLWQALQQVFRTRIFQRLLMAAINIYLFANVALNTLIPLSSLFLIYAIAFLAGISYWRISKSRKINTGWFNP